MLGACGAAAGPGSDGPPALREEACALILSTNDTHGQLLPRTPSWAGGREVGGAAALGGHLREARSEEPDCPAFLLSGGDVMQGTAISSLLYGESTIATFNRLGYDAAAIGNHEFDWGTDVLRERIAQAEFPFLGANIFRKGTDRHPEWVEPWTLLERDGVRVGVIGGVTRSTPSIVRPDLVADLEFGSLSDAFDRYIPELRERGVHFVVLLMHAGGFCEDDGAACRGEAISALESTAERFDYAATGHTHSLVKTEISGAPVVQSGSSSLAFGIGRLERNAEGERSAEVLDVRTTYVDETEPDADVARLVQRYREGVGEYTRRPVAIFARALERRGREYPLGRLIADAQGAAAGARAAIMNNGGIRAGVPADTVTYGDLFEVQPFQNRLVRLRLSGETLRRTLEHALGADGPRAHVSGIEVRYDPRGGPGTRIQTIRIGDSDRDLHPDSVYTVAVNDFMAAGGDDYTMLAGAEEREETGIVDLDALVEYLDTLPSPVEPPREARWIAVEGS